MPPARLGLTGVPTVAWLAQATPIRRVIGVQPSGNQLVTTHGMVVSVQRGGKAASRAMSTWASVLSDADAERVAGEDAWAEAGAVLMVVASLCCCASLGLGCLLACRAATSGHDGRAARCGAGLKGAGHRPPANPVCDQRTWSRRLLVNAVDDACDEPHVTEPVPGVSCPWPGCTDGG